MDGTPLSNPRRPDGLCVSKQVRAAVREVLTPKSRDLLARRCSYRIDKDLLASNSEPYSMHLPDSSKSSPLPYLLPQYSSKSQVPLASVVEWQGSVSKVALPCVPAAWRPDPRLAPLTQKIYVLDFFMIAVNLDLAVYPPQSTCTVETLFFSSAHFPVQYCTRTSKTGRPKKTLSRFPSLQKQVPLSTSSLLYTKGLLIHPPFGFRSMASEANTTHLYTDTVRLNVLLG